VWTGVLTRVQSDDDLAVILGHETAHYTRAHTLERFRRIRSGMASGALASLGFGLVTGVLMPIGEAAALMNVLAYSRTQEEEADLLGAKMVADASLDPHASYRLWQRLVEEEQRASDKGKDQGFFMRSHPESEQRATTLQDWVVTTYGPTPATAPSPGALMPLLIDNYMMLMTDQIKTNRYGRTELLLEWHEAMGVDVALVEFFRAQMYAQRGADGDDQRVVQAYEKSVATGRAPAEAYRNLGYVYVKANDMSEAQALFRKYLDLSPDATDRAMIEFYTKEP
jgi:beta-barrel assembly-enhancing protease